MRKKKFSKNVGVMLDDETYQQLVSITDAKETTVSQFVREIVQNYLTKNIQGGEQQ